MNKILKEPFFHFISIGFAIFILYALVNENTTSKDSIILDDAEINELIAKWETQWKRAPNESELYTLISQTLRQEIYYREALKMNLDNNDEIIKRRLSQKMKFLANDLASLKKVSEEELVVYFKENSEKYLKPSVYSIYQVVFTSDDRNDPINDAKKVLGKYPTASFETMKNKGDKFPIPYYLENVGEDELRSELGIKFIEGIKPLSLNQWHGPVSSGFGQHLVFISNKKEAYIPVLEEVKQEVIRDYEYDHEQEIEESIYLELKKNYVVELDVQSEDFDPELVKLLQKEINK